MKTLFALTKNTFRETIRDRILLVIAFFGVIFIVTSYFLSALSPRNEEKMLLDIGLGLVDIFGMLVTIFVGIQLIFREVDKRTIFVIFSKPVSRSSFLISKFFGLGAILTLITFVMLCVFIGVLLFKTNLIVSGEVIDFAFLGKILLISSFSLLSFLLMLALVIFFSSFMTPVLAAFSALSMFVVGHLTDDLRIFAMFNSESTPLIQKLADVFYFGLPNFSLLNMKNFVLNDIAFSALQLIAISASALLWIVVLLLLASAFFSQREF